MNTSTSKTIVAIIVIAVIGIFIYLGTGKSETDTLDTIDVSNDPSMIGSDIQALLGQLNSLKIDSEIFTNPVYKSLNDYTNTIPALPQGKKNPFAPFPGTILKSSKTQ